MTDYDKEYFEFCKIALEHGHIIKSSGRQMVKYGDKQVPLSRALWNKHYPDDPVLSTEVIHHINGDKMDNNITNLQKMTAGEHTKLHIEHIRRLKQEGKPYPYKTRGPSGKPKKKRYVRIYPDWK